jgi:GTP-binding protein HflX
MVASRSPPLARERVVLVGASLPSLPPHRVEENLDELAELVDSAGGTVVRRFVQTLERVSPATYVGKGKAEEIAAHCRAAGVGMVVFDDELTPAQVRNLEACFGIKVCDRTAVILDIFARRARTREARTQVELAQYTYLLPRLTRAWSHLSRQAGGIGTRGVGETQLETDRRVIRRRIALLTRELRHIAAHRDVQRRRRADTFEVALVGYTNAGKSSLMNRLTSAKVRVEDRLFVTLDTTFRRLHLDGLAVEVLLIDTVGFVRKLPHHLVASFRSTLEQAREADLILHVLDVSHPAFEEHAATTHQILSELSLDEIPVLTVLNKTDVAPGPVLLRAEGLYPESLAVSALTGDGLEALRAAIARAVRRLSRGTNMLIPYERWPDFVTFRKRLHVLREVYGEDGVTVTLRGREGDMADLARAFGPAGANGPE